VGTVYQYFSTREALVAASEKRMWERITSDFMARVGVALPALADQRMDALVFSVAFAALDAIADKALLYRFERGDVAPMARLPEKRELVEGAAAFLVDALAQAGRLVHPENVRVASKLVVESAAALTFVWAADQPAAVVSKRFQYEMASMFARYLTREPSPHPFPSPVESCDRTRARPAVADPGKAPRCTPTQARSALTVRAILDAVGRVLAANGMGGVTMTRVAAEAGLAPSALYRYYSTKSALLAAWEERIFEVELDAFGAHVGALLGTIPEHGPLGAAGIYKIARAGVDAMVNVARIYQFDGSANAFVSRPQQRFEFADRAAAFLAAALETRAAFVFPEALRDAALLVVTTVAVEAMSWAAEEPALVASGAFQHELATMVTRYIVKAL
jgi:AcrR family transcriptional regulator